MSVLARLLLRRPDMTPVRMEDRVISFECSRGENTPGAFTCVMPMRDDYAGVGPDWIIELQRSFDGGASWDNDLQSLWFVRTVAIDVADRIELLTLTGFDQLSLLDRRVVAYYSVDAADNGQTYYSMKNVAADLACRQLVAENFTDAILAVPDEDLPGPVDVIGAQNRILSFIKVETAPAIAQVVQVECAWQPVGEALRSVSAAAAEKGERLLFDLVASAGQLLFRVWIGRRGVDLTRQVVFSLAAGNIAGLRMVQDYSREVTLMYVGGDGQNKDKVVAGVRADRSTFARTPWYPIEGYVDAADAKNDQALMEARGGREMRKLAPRWTFSAQALDGGQTVFGRDYHYGDLVSVSHRGQHSICRVSRFRLRYEGGVETQVEVPLESEEPL